MRRQTPPAPPKKPEPFTTLDVKEGRPRPGAFVYGPDYYRCFNTGSSPCLYRLTNSAGGGYVVCWEADRHDAARAWMMTNRRRRNLTLPNGRQAWGFKTRAAALAKFLERCNARLDENHRAAMEHWQATCKALRGDLAATLAMGDY